MKSIVSVKWLNENLNNPNLVLLYSNLGSKKEHPVYIKNTRLFDIKNDFSDLNSPFPNTFPSVQLFQKKCRNLGINNDSIIVVYDDRGVYSAPRVWWMLTVMGCKNVSVLNGGVNEWLKAENPIVPVLTRTFESGNFKANFNKNAVKYFSEIEENITTKKMLVIDARSSNRFNALVPEPREGLRSGNIPNAINIPYINVLDDDIFKAKAELKQIFKTISDEKELVFSCGSGVTACIVLLAAFQVLNNKLSIYDGSWTEWAQLTEL